MRIVVGGVGQLYQSDLDLGRRVVEQLHRHDLGGEVVVEDFHYGAVAVAQRIEELGPEALVLVGAEARGRDPGTVERRRVADRAVDPALAQDAIEGAVTGHVGIDLVVEVARALGALPSRTIVIEVEPARTDPGEDLSPEGAGALARLVERVRVELERTPLFELTDRVRERLEENRIEASLASSVLDDLLDELEQAERTGGWGAAFVRRDELRLRIARGETGEGMDQLDWTLWWALIEELDRLQAVEAAQAP